MRKPYDIELGDPRFYNQYKDGVPETILEKLIAHNYLIVVIMVWIVAFWLSLRVLKDKFYIKVYIYVNILSMPIAFMWGYWMHYADPLYKGWNAVPFQTIGMFVGWSYEDILFYTGSCFFYYTIFRLWMYAVDNWDNVIGWVVTPYKYYGCLFIINWVCYKIYHILKFLKLNSFFSLRQDWKHFSNIKVGFFVLMCICTAFFFFIGTGNLITTIVANEPFHGGLCGIALSLMYAVPGLLLMIYVWKELNIKVFIFFFLYMLAFEVIWDLAFVSWVHFPDGFAWASGWHYISFDSLGNYFHSRIFLDYVIYPWAWIFENPIEITPWYGMVGAFYPYMLILACDKFFKIRKFKKV